MSEPTDGPEQSSEPESSGRVPALGWVLLIWYVAMVVIAIATGEVATVLLAAIGLTAFVLPGIWLNRRRRRGS